jgi:hypothetical protein
LLQLPQHADRQRPVLGPGESELCNLLEVEHLPDLRRQLLLILSLCCQDVGERRVGPLQRARALRLATQRRPTQQGGLRDTPRRSIEASKCRGRRVNGGPGAGRKHEIPRQRIGQESFACDHLMGNRIWPTNWDKTTDRTYLKRSDIH